MARARQPHEPQHPQSLGAQHHKSIPDRFQPQHSWPGRSSALPQKVDPRADIL